MAEEQKNILESAKDMLSDKVGDAGNLVGKAKEFIGEKAGEMLANSEEIKKKVVEMGKAITPDSLDDKVEGIVDQAVDFLKDKFGGEEKEKEQ